MKLAPLSLVIRLQYFGLGFAGGAVFTALADVLYHYLHPSH